MLTRAYLFPFKKRDRGMPQFGTIYFEDAVITALDYGKYGEDESCAFRFKFEREHNNRLFEQYKTTRNLNTLDELLHEDDDIEKIQDLIGREIFTLEMSEFDFKYLNTPHKAKEQLYSKVQEIGKSIVYAGLSPQEIEEVSKGDYDTVYRAYEEIIKDSPIKFVGFVLKNEPWTNICLPKIRQSILRITNEEE